MGRAGARVSRIALGTMNMGPITSEEDSFAMMDVAHEHGVNFFDTADVYGGRPWGDRIGQTEEIVGRWLADRSARDNVILATKVHGATGGGINDSGLSALHIRRAVEASLSRLQTEHIDLYQMHHIDREVPVDEILNALTRLRQDGKIIYVGSSNFAGWNIAQYQEIARALGQAPLVTEQSVYSLAKRTVELEVVPAIREYGMGLLPWSPLAGGELAGVLAKSETARSDPAQLGNRRRQIELYEAFARRRDMDPAEMGIAWLLHQPAVIAPVVGPRRLEHLVSAISAVDVELTVEDLQELDEIWPGPGGAAPEAYAW